MTLCATASATFWKRKMVAILRWERVQSTLERSVLSRSRFPRHIRFDTRFDPGESAAQSRPFSVAAVEPWSASDSNKTPAGRDKPFYAAFQQQSRIASEKLFVVAVNRRQVEETIRAEVPFDSTDDQLSIRVPNFCCDHSNRIRPEKDKFSDDEKQLEKFYGAVSDIPVSRKPAGAGARYGSTALAEDRSSANARL
jgi:hypothetical protein